MPPTRRSHRKRGANNGKVLETAALWFSRDRVGGPGAYDIWMSKRTVAISFSARTGPASSAVTICIVSPSRRTDSVNLRISGPKRTALATSGRRCSHRMAGACCWRATDEVAQGRFDLFVADVLEGGGFGRPAPLPGDVNTGADEFDATYLDDGVTVVFTRARDLSRHRPPLRCLASRRSLRRRRTATAKRQPERCRCVCSHARLVQPRPDHFRESKAGGSCRQHGRIRNQVSAEAEAVGTAPLLGDSSARGDRVFDGRRSPRGRRTRRVLH